MKENNNPNFDFYSFNLPNPNEQGEKEVKIEQPQDAPRPIVSDPVVVPNETEPSSNDEQYNKDIDVALYRTKLKCSYSRLGWGFVVMTVVFYVIAQIIVDNVYLYAPDIYESYWFSSLVGTMPLYFVGIPALYLIIRPMDRQAPEKKKLPATHFLILFVISQMIMLAGSIMGETFVSTLGTMTGINFENSLNDALNVPFWLSMLTTVIAAPLFEELIFRKLLMDRMLPYGEFSAILVSSLLFGAFHGNFYQFFYATMLGLLLAFMYARTGKWLLGVLMHMIINFIGGVVPTLIMNWLDYDTFLTLSEEQLMPYISEHMGAYLSMMGLSVLRYGLGIAGLILIIVHWRKFALRRREGELAMSDSLFSSLTSPGIIGALVTCGLLFALWFLSAWISTISMV